MRRAVAAAGAGLALALAAVLGVGEAAFAHDQLVQSDPEEGSTVDELDAVTLTFSAAILGASDESANLAQVTGPDGLHYETACAAVSDAVLTVPVSLGPPGEYTVGWRVVSADGHPVSGDYSFTYEPSGEANAVGAAEVSPCGAVAAAGDTADAAAGDDGTTSGLVVGLSAGAVVIGILVLIVTTGLQARKKKDDPGE